MTQRPVIDVLEYTVWAAEEDRRAELRGNMSGQVIGSWIGPERRWGAVLEDWWNALLFGRPRKESEDSKTVSFGAITAHADGKLVFVIVAIMVCAFPLFAIPTAGLWIVLVLVALPLLAAFVFASTEWTITFGKRGKEKDRTRKRR